MALIKCPECKKEISDRAASCPQCGCPIDSNSSQSEKRCPECGQSVSGFVEFCPNCGFPMNEDSQSDVSVKELNNTTKKKSLKRAWLIVGVVLLVALLIAGVALLPRWRMKAYIKAADEFKKSLPQSTEILCEVIDSTATKIYYIEKDSSYISAYDFATKTKSVINFSESGELQYGYKVRKYNDRLFVIVSTGACGSGLGNQECVYYINVRDNSSHYVVCCEEANFLDNGEIFVKRAFPIDYTAPSYEWEWKRDEYKVSTALTDEEYSSIEKKQEEKEEIMAREERN